MAIELVVTQDFGVTRPAVNEDEQPTLKTYRRGETITDGKEMDEAQKASPHCVVRRTRADPPPPAPPAPAPSNQRVG